MKIIVISTPDKMPNEQDIVNELFKQGMEIFHIRKPKWSIDEMDEYLKEIDNDFHPQIVIHSNYRLCEKYNLKGIHFTGKTKELSHKFTDWNVHKSISCHSIEEVVGLTEKMDYLFLSPFFDSLSKKGYRPTFDMERLKIFCKQHSNNIIAMGGITPENIEKIKDFNLYGISVLGYIWQNNSMNKIIKAYNELKASINNNSIRYKIS